MVESNNLIILNDPDQATYHDARTNNSDILDYAVATAAVARIAKACSVGEDFGSDYLSLIIELQPNHRINRHEQIMHRPLGSCDWGRYAAQLDEEIEPTQDGSLFSQQAIDSRCEEVQQAITTALDTACPLRPILKGTFRVSKSTLQLIREKRRTKRFHQRTGDPLLKTTLNNLAGKVKRAIAKEKQEAWQRATEDLNSLQGAQLWKQFHNLTGTREILAGRQKARG